MTDTIEAHSKFMRTVDNSEILAGSETLVVPKRGNPALVVTNIGVASYRKEGQTAFSWIGAVRTGNTENIRSPVLAEILPGADMPEACETIYGVVYLVRAQAVCVTN